MDKSIILEYLEYEDLESLGEDSMMRELGEVDMDATKQVLLNCGGMRGYVPQISSLNPTCERFIRSNFDNMKIRDMARIIGWPYQRVKGVVDIIKSERQMQLFKDSDDKNGLTTGGAML